MTGPKQTSTYPPPLPPTTEADRFNRLRLLRSRRVGVATYRRLMAEHETAAAALNDLPEVAQAAGVVDYQPCPKAVIAAELKAGERQGAALVIEGDADYPAALYDVADAPPILWTLGQIQLLKRPMIALVGARNASSLGTRMAKRLAAELGEAGYVVVSGLARGVDTAAHLAALDSGTIAVQAGGIETVYPVENAALAADIAKRGLRVSEMPMGTQPQARHFPARNRIIAGLAQAVVIVEAAAKSGSLITARNALDQGRDVLAVPGHPCDARSAGCNMLIRDGATLVRSASDVIDALSPIAAPAFALATDPTDEYNQAAQRPPTILSKSTKAPKRGRRDSAKLHDEILARLGPSPVAEDQLIRDLATGPRSVAPVLMELELDGKITRQSGGLLARVV